MRQLIEHGLRRAGHHRFAGAVDGVGGRAQIGPAGVRAGFTAAAEIPPPALRRIRELHPGGTVRGRDLDVDEVTDTAATLTLTLVESRVGVSVVTDLMLRLRPSRLDVPRGSAGRLPHHDTVVGPAVHDRRK